MFSHIEFLKPHSGFLIEIPTLTVYYVSFLVLIAPVGYWLLVIPFILTYKMQCRFNMKMMTKKSWFFQMRKLNSIFLVKRCSL